MDILSDHAAAISNAIEAAEEDGLVVEALTCCCGEGLRIKNKDTGEEEYIL